MDIVDFDSVQTRVYDFLKSVRLRGFSKKDKGYKLPLSDAVFCAEDIGRNRRFWEGIGLASCLRGHEDPSVPRSGTSPLGRGELFTVVDAGSGTGVLGLFALLQGAGRCVFLEHNPHSLEVSKKLLAEFGLLGRCEFVECDATKVDLSESFDLLISETLSSGFVDEDFVAIVKNLCRFGQAIQTPTGPPLRADQLPLSRGSEVDGCFIIIPERFEMSVEMLDEEGGVVGKFLHSFESTKGFAPVELNVSPDVCTFRFRTKCWLFGDKMVSSGDCVSFLNERVVEVEGFTNPVFRVMKR